ncbi:MAG: cell division protein ZapA [Oscillospiraceae bacterium]
MNKVKVTICGKDYSLMSEEKPSYYTSLAKKVENAINEMTSQSKSLTIQSAAVLAALSAFDDAQKANESIDNIRTQIKEYVNDACKARAERDEAQKEIDALKIKISQLENDLKISEMKAGIDNRLSEKSKK